MTGYLVVAADLPLAGPEALGRVALALGGAPVVVVPSADGSGTNVLGGAADRARRRSPRAGPGGAARHLAADGAIGMDEPALAADVDTMADLAGVLGRLAPGSVTARRVRDLKLADKLAEQLGREQTRS